MNRRTFLGAAAALAALPTEPVAADVGDREGERQDGDAPLFAAFFTDTADTTASYNVQTYQDDDCGMVAGLNVYAEFGSVTIEVTADQAEELGGELLEAAREDRP